VLGHLSVYTGQPLQASSLRKVFQPALRKVY
jgi:hypothetical protein